MGRLDQMEALYEFFGGTPNTYHTSPANSVFGWLQTIVKGQPFDILELQMPTLYILAPEAREHRQAAQKKFIDYQLEAYLIAFLDAGGGMQGDRAPTAIEDFYGWMDDIANKIRTNKQLITTSYPNGASIRFGEDSSSVEEHWRQEDTLVIAAKFEIISTEQVNA